MIQIRLLFEPRNSKEILENYPTINMVTLHIENYSKHTCEHDTCEERYHKEGF